MGCRCRGVCDALHRILLCAEQAARIAKLLGTEEYAVQRIAEPVDLLDSSRNRFLSPLSHS